MSPTHQDLSNDTTFSQIKSRVPVPLNRNRYLVKKGGTDTLVGPGEAVRLKTQWTKIPL